MKDSCRKRSFSPRISWLLGQILNCVRARRLPGRLGETWWLKSLVMSGGSEKNTGSPDWVVKDSQRKEGCRFKCQINLSVLSPQYAVQGDTIYVKAMRRKCSQET